MNNNWMHGEGSSYDRFQLLRFWSRHPDTHFNLPSLHAAMEGDLVDVGEALAPLVEEGIVKQERDPHGAVIYSLAPDAEVRIQVCDDLIIEAETAEQDAQQALRTGAVTRVAVLQADAYLADARAAKTLSKLDMSLAYATWARATGRLSELFLAPTAPSPP